jgi:hypothetical protein
MHFAICMRSHWHRMRNKMFEQLRKVKIRFEIGFCIKQNNLNKCILNGVSLTPPMNFACGVIDTACKIWHTMRPWQPLKGMSIKNIFITEMTYPTTRNVNFNGANNQNKFLCLRCQWHHKHKNRVSSKTSFVSYFVKYKTKQVSFFAKFRYIAKQAVSHISIFFKQNQTAHFACFVTNFFNFCHS